MPIKELTKLQEAGITAQPELPLISDRYVQTIIYEQQKQITLLAKKLNDAIDVINQLTTKVNTLP